MLQKIIRVGTHSLAVIIPADFIHALGVKAGNRVKVQTFTNTGKVLLKFSGTFQLLLPTSNLKKKKNEK